MIPHLSSWERFCGGRRNGDIIDSSEDGVGARVTASIAVPKHGHSGVLLFTSNVSGSSSETARARIRGTCYVFPLHGNGLCRHLASIGVLEHPRSRNSEHLHSRLSSANPGCPRSTKD